MAAFALRRRFTEETKDPFEGVSWSKRHSRILDHRGQEIFFMSGVEAPSSWSQLAVDIAASKYFRKRGVSSSPRDHESSVRELVNRLSSSLMRFAVTSGRFSESSARVFHDELVYVLLHQKAAFNSPVWFNLGLYEAYGLKGQEGNWRFNSASGRSEPVAHSYIYPQTSACFIQSIQDDLMGIFELAKNEAQIFKYGSGTGSNFSTLRSKYEQLENGGFSSGLMSFLDVLDKGAGATKSGGTVRRAAKMVCLDADHPEIFEFVRWKEQEEYKARALIKAGYGQGFEDEAYRTVGGQNSNNSVRVSDEFMKAVVKDGTWSTRFRTEEQVHRTFPARELWKAIAHSAWFCADPGLQYDSTIQKWHTCPNSGRINASNPCSEYMFLDDSACNLASVNLAAFLNDAGQFQVEDYLHVCRLMLTAQDLLIDLSSYPTAKIAENSVRFRPLGLGYANLGGLLMRMGIGYASEKAHQWTALLTSLMQAQALLASSEMAAAWGAFDGFGANRDAMLSVTEGQSGVFKLEERLLSKDLLEKNRQLWKSVLEHSHQHGFRNSQVTAIAPTGTIGLLMDCDTTGIEPDFSLVKLKKMAGGGYVKILNQSVPTALKRLGYSTGEINELTRYLENNQTLEGAKSIKAEHLEVFDCANRCGPKGERVLHWSAHLHAVAAAQGFVSGSVSKTVNLPAEATEQMVEDIYMQAWQLGLKSISIYRDGSKLSQPLNPGSTMDQEAMGTPDCAECGFKTVLAGACFKCLNCGHTTSC